MTATAPTLDILVPTLGERATLFHRLMSVLLPQLDPYAGEARVLGWFSNGTPSLPVIRQSLLERSSADYTVFVDDDDLVAPYYVAEIMSALAHRPDYVGYQVQCYSNGRPTLIAYHSLEYPGWANESHRYVRDISHINPMRRTSALSADFRRVGTGAAEDRAWVDQLRRGKVLRQEIVVPRIMYHYLHIPPSRVSGSRWKDPRAIKRGHPRPAIDHPYFRWEDQ